MSEKKPRGKPPSSASGPNHGLSPMDCPRHAREVDLFNDGAQEHWYEAYPLLHDAMPVVRLEGEGPTPDTDGFILTKHEDIARVVKDPERFPPRVHEAITQIEQAQNAGKTLPGVNAMLASMVTLRPSHDLYRSHRQELTDPWVGPGATRHSEMIKDCANRLIDRFIGEPRIDFVQQFARPLPQMVMANMLGFPEADIPLLAEWGNAQVAAFVYGKGHRNLLSREESDAQFEKLEAFKGYVQTHVAEKRGHPQDDMISWLTQVHYEALDRTLTDLEVNGVVYAMIIGGLETTQYALEEAAQLICDRPGLWQTLKSQPTLIRNFVEESMRLRSPTQGLSTRLTSQDEVFQGVSVPKGSLLHLRFAAGNVDPDEWDCPFELNLERKALTRHLVFSAGPRVCPGAGISRLEQNLAWSTLLARLPGIRYAPDNTFEHQPGIMLGTLALNLEITGAD
jgi:cytochrome P450